MPSHDGVPGGNTASAMVFGDDEVVRAEAAASVGTAPLTPEAMKEERDRLVDDLAMARERAASGEAPDEDAEREWARRVRSEETASAAARDREDAAAAAARADGSTTSRAAQRPNAYVPSDPKSMGVPRPYGAHAPFKPTAPGANMRHYRAPEPREIVIN